MINISVRYLVNFSIITGRKQEDLSLPEESKLKDLLAKLTEKYGDHLRKELFSPETDEIKPHVLILINGRSLDQFKYNVDTVLENRDTVIFTFPVTGG